MRRCECDCSAAGSAVPTLHDNWQGGTSCPAPCRTAATHIEETWNSAQQCQLNRQQVQAACRHSTHLRVLREAKAIRQPVPIVVGGVQRVELHARGSDIVRSHLRCGVHRRQHGGGDFGRLVARANCRAVLGSDGEGNLGGTWVLVRTGSVRLSLRRAGLGWPAADGDMPKHCCRRQAAHHPHVGRAGLLGLASEGQGALEWPGAVLAQLGIGLGITGSHGLAAGTQEERQQAGQQH